MPLPRLGKIDSEDTEEFARTLRTHFDKVLDVNYEAIFEKNVFDEIPLPPKLTRSLNDFIEELGTYNLAKIRSDVLGRVYEGLIPGGERHRLGQYYTPPPIVELIVEMCVRSPNDTVLDPGCGSGGFLVKAYHKLRDLKKKEDPLKDEAELHREILDQLRGIDINAFPAQLAAMNLAARNLKARSDNIGLVVSDFFKIAPNVPVFPKEFDAVVTNPPYTRQEEMEYKEEIRDAALTYTDGSKIDLDARAGIYAYFFIHSAKFLRNGGRMGYITSDTWLDVGFGKGLKRFFLDHFKILTVIWYDVRAFERPLVGTCITILEKEEDSKDARDENMVKFVRIKKPMAAEDIVKTVEATMADFEDERIGVALKKQVELQPTEKWGKYLRAPTVYFKITQHPKMTRLGKIAEIRRGFTTGADGFFYLDEEQIKLWGIEREYLKPIVTSPRGKGVEIKLDDVDKYVLIIHQDKEELSKRRFNVLKYIEWGESREVRVRGGRRGGVIVKGYHNLSTIKSRKRWYDLGKRKPAPILFARKMWESCVYALNEANAYAHQCFYELCPHSTGDTLVLTGILNSTATALLSELKGRFYGGGVLELTVYECKELPVLDPNKLTIRERTRIEKAFLRLCDAQRGGDEEAEKWARKELDNAVFDALGLNESEREQVYEGLGALRRMRLQRKEVEVLVETPEEWRPPRRKEKAPEERPSRGLGPWLKGET